MTLLWIFVLIDCFYQSWAKNLMTLLLLLGEDKRRLHCFTLWPATMLLKRIPLFDPRLTLSSFLMDSSRYTSNTTSIRELSAPAHGADMKMASINQSINLYLNTVKSIRNLKIKDNLTILNKIQNLTTTNLTKTCFSWMPCITLKMNIN